MYNDFKQREQIYIEAVKMKQSNAQDIFDELEKHSPGMNEIHKTEIKSPTNVIITTIYVHTKYGKMKLSEGSYLVKQNSHKKISFTVMDQNDLNSKYDMVSKSSYSDLSERAMDGQWVYAKGGD
jgi:hypothetical protein